MKEIAKISSGVSLYHHQNQAEPYPDKETLEELSKIYSKEELVKIKSVAEIISVIDCYDSMKYKNDGRTGEIQLSNDEIKAFMLNTRPNNKDLINNLYDAGIFK